MGTMVLSLILIVDFDWNFNDLFAMQICMYILYELGTAVINVKKCWATVRQIAAFENFWKKQKWLRRFINDYGEIGLVRGLVPQLFYYFFHATGSQFGQRQGGCCWCMWLGNGDFQYRTCYFTYPDFQAIRFRFDPDKFCIL